MKNVSLLTNFFHFLPYEKSVAKAHQIVSGTQSEVDIERRTFIKWFLWSKNGTFHTEHRHSGRKDKVKIKNSRNYFLLTAARKTKVISASYCD